MPNAGFSVTIDTSGAKANIDALRQSMDTLTQQTKQSSTQTAQSMDALTQQTKQAALQAAQWQVAMAKRDAINGAAGAVDAYGHAVENLARLQGVCEKEAVALGEKAATQAALMQKAARGASEMGTALGNLVVRLGAAATGYLSLRASMEFLSDSTKLAARYDTMGVVVKTIGTNAGYATEYVDGLTQSLQASGITMNASRQSVSQMIQAHMDLAEATKLSRAAQDAAVIGNTNSSEAFERMIYAIQSGQPEMLRTLGINTNFDTAYQKLAITLHTTTAALTENQKMQARVNATMEATRAISGTYESAMETAGKQALSLSRYWEDLKVNLGEAFQPAYRVLIEETTNTLKEFTNTVKDKEFQESIKEWAKNLSAVLKYMEKIAFYSGLKSPGATADKAQELIDQGRLKQSDLQNPAWEYKVKSNSAFVSGGLVGGAIGGAAGGALGGVAGFGALSAVTGPIGYAVGAAAGAAIGGTLARVVTGSYQQSMELQKTVNTVLQDDIRLKESFSPPWYSQQSYNGDTGRLPVVHSYGGSSFRAPVTPGMPPDVANQLKKQRDNVFNDLQNYVMPYLQNNRSYLSTEEQMKYADETLEGDKKNFEILRDLAKERGDVQMEQNAYMALNEAIQKNIQTKAALIRADDAVRRSVQDMASENAALQADLAGDKYTSESIKSLQSYNDELAQFNERMATYKGANKDSLTAAGQQWIAEKYALEQARIELEKWQDAMQSAASMLTTYGQLSGDPRATYAGTMTTNQLWYVEQQKRIAAIKDEGEQAKQTAELEATYSLKELDARRQAYSQMSAVSSAYWATERQYLEMHLSVVKQNATDETAYRIYAAEQWDNYSKAWLEHQTAYSGSFGETFAAKWSLAFGTYKSELTRARDDYQDFSDSVITLTQGMADAMAGSLGDVLRKFSEDGTVTLESFNKTMRSRFMDAAASFIEKNYADTIKENLGKLGSMIFGGSATDQNAPQAITTPQATLEAAQATINISGSVSGLPSLDYTQSGTIIGQSAGQVIAQAIQPIIVQSQTAQGQNIQQNMAVAGEKTAQAIPDALKKSIWYTHDNPGNLRVPGQTAFQQFDTMEAGLQAMYRQLSLDFSRGLDTPYSLIHKYAPESDGNNTTAYATAVAKAMGLDNMNSKMDLRNGDQMQSMMEAMVKIETGVNSTMIASKDTYYNIAHQIADQAVPTGTAAGQAAAPIIAAALRGGGSQQPNTTFAGQPQEPTLSFGGLELTQEQANRYFSLDQYGSGSAYYSPTTNQAYGIGLTSLDPSIATKAADLIPTGSQQPNNSMNPKTIMGNLAGVATSALSLVGALQNGNTGSIAGAGISSIGSLATMASAFGLGGSWLGPVGVGVGILGGVLGSLFGGSNQKTKKYDGTISSYSGGQASAYPVTVMSDGSMEFSFVPAETMRKTQKSFDDLVTSIKKAGKTLDIDLVDNFENKFSFFSGAVPSSMASAAQFTMEDILGNTALGTLGAAVKYFSDGVENTTDIFLRLADSAKTVIGTVKSLGIDFDKFAAIDNRFLESIAAFATGTESTVEILDNGFSGLADSVATATDYMTQYSTALRSLAEAEMSKLYEDALGGSDEFTSAMQIYAKYGITTQTQKEDALSYYQSQLSKLVTSFSNEWSSVLPNFESSSKIDATNISTFWSAYNDAMQESMPPDMLASWAEMAEYAKEISDTESDLEKINAQNDAWDANLKARSQESAGLSKEAEVTKLLAGYETELLQAKQNDMTYTQQAALVQVQIEELTAKYNTAIGATIDYTASLDAALTEFNDTLESTISSLSNVASTASSLSSTWDSIDKSLEKQLESILEETTSDYTALIDARMTQLNTAYTKGMAGDSDYMSEVADDAASAWEAVKKGAVTGEQYDTAKWTIISQLSMAKATSSGMSTYEKTISSLATDQVDISKAIEAELKEDNIDTNFLSLATSLQTYISQFQDYVDEYKQGLISKTEFEDISTTSSDEISSWIVNFIGKYATLSASQARALVSQSAFISESVSEGTDLTVDQLAALYNSSGQVGADTIEAILGNSTFLEQLMKGNIQLSGLSSKQATLLSSSLSAMETVGEYTGTSMTYSDMATYFLAKISDGVSIDGWSSLISAIANGQNALIASFQSGIEQLQSTLQNLTDQAAAQSALQAQQSAYYKSQQQTLYKESQVELYTSKLNEAKSTLSQDNNYLAYSFSQGNAIAIAAWWSKAQEAQQQVNELQSQLDYWTNLDASTIQLATGGIVSSPTLAWVGEGQETEVVQPLSNLKTLLADSNSNEALLAEIQKLNVRIAQVEVNTRTTANNTYDRSKSASFAARS